MRIVSQNKTVSLEFSRVDIYVEYEHIFAKSGDRQYMLGRYENEERAMQVFSEIHQNNAEIYYLPAMQ